MARIGENIQAGLGRVDYSPLAQGIIAGAQARAQGIASLGQSAATAITAYFKRKEEDQRISSEIQSLKSLSQRPGGKAILEPLNIFKDDGSFDDATATALIRERGLNGVVTLGSALKDLERQAKLETTNKKAIDYSSILEMGGGKVPAPYSNDFIKKGFTPEERALGRDMYVKQQTQGVQLDLARSEIAKNLAQARATGMPKPEDLTFQEQTLNEAIRAEEVRLGRKLTPAESFDVRKMVINLTGQKGTTINMPGEDKTSENLYKNLQTERTASIQPIIDADSINSTLNDLLKNPDLITGKTAQAELFVKSIGNDLGITDFKDVGNTQLFISLVGQRIKSSIKAFGSATAVSDGDRIYTEKIEGGDITSQLEGIRQLQAILNDQARKKIFNFNKRVEKVFPDQGRYKAALIVSEEEAPFTLQQQPDYIYRGGRLIQNSNK